MLTAVSISISQIKKSKSFWEDKWWTWYSNPSSLQGVCSLPRLIYDNRREENQVKVTNCNCFSHFCSMAIYESRENKRIKLYWRGRKGYIRWHHLSCTTEYGFYLESNEVSFSSVFHWGLLELSCIILLFMDEPARMCGHRVAVGWFRVTLTGTRLPPFTSDSPAPSLSMFSLQRQRYKGTSGNAQVLLQDSPSITFANAVQSKSDKWTQNWKARDHTLLLDGKGH